MLPGYDFCLKCSHTFNLLEARGAISVTERTAYIGRIRELARRSAEAYVNQRAEMGHPLLRGRGGGLMAELLFEIGSEEMPARFVAPAMAALGEMAGQELSRLGLAFETLADLRHPPAPGPGDAGAWPAARPTAGRWPWGRR